jgi:hypothetical protein
MGAVNGFVFDKDTGNVRMYAGDTGSYKLHVTRESGEAWTEDARLLYTVTGASGIVIQRIYRLDDQYDLGDGWILIEFHNDDTDELDPGDYTIEGRANVDPVWDGTPSSARCVDALAAGAAHMIEGVPVRTLFKCTLHIDSVDGRI